MKFKKALTVAMASISLMGCATFATQTVKADKHPFSYWYHYSHSDYMKHDSSIEIKTTKPIVMKKWRKNGKYYGHKTVKKGTVLRADAMNYGWYLWYPGWIYPHKTTNWFKVIYSYR